VEESGIPVLQGIEMVPIWKRIPYLRWSFWRLLHLMTQWQVGDGGLARGQVVAVYGDLADEGKVT
jgi:hypothetical protein